MTEVFNQRGSQNPFRMVSYEEHRVIHLTLLPINFQSNPSLSLSYKPKRQWWSKQNNSKLLFGTLSLCFCLFLNLLGEGAS